ncbi:MAG: response regulator [Chitinophagaceae bacterium]|nr:response regulator [Chitinophagaceae bacterium]
MEGYDNTWHYPGTFGKISYNNILPGAYILRVKWSNGEGVWTESMALLDLTVKQYFWLRWYALFTYALLASLLVYIIYKYRRNKFEIKQQLVLEHAMRTREEELHEDRISFFTYIAHELQTPLTLIMGSIERFIDKTVAPEGQREKPYFLSLVHQQASKLTYLVHQLMEFRKMESGFFKNQYSYIDISGLLTNLAEPFMPLGELNGMGYDFHIAPGINGWTDKDKLEKIIFNLLSNAFKHADKGAKIVITAFENTSGLAITVANSGCSLEPDQLNKLFDKFYVAGLNNLGTEKFGTGIGLAFARQLVTLLGGRIEARNEKGWISFNVHLPLKPDTAVENIPMSAAEPQSGRPSYLYQSITSYNDSIAPASVAENNKQALIEKLQETSRRNVLIVEDEQEIRYLLKDILKDDYIVSEAEDGKKAIELMLKIVPDLIICDVMMPNMDGLEFCNRVKNTPATCHIPVIILSARDAVGQHMEGYEVGADAYIAKPFHTAHLKIRVRKLIENAQRLHNFFSNPNAINALTEASLPDGDKQFLMNLVEIIEENMDEPEFGAASVEKNLSLSKMQLYRRLKTLTGMTPGEFIKHIRLKHAAQLLVTTRLTVSEIFHKTGFNNQSYFFREFKKRYQSAPNEYRQRQTVHIR